MTPRGMTLALAALLTAATLVAIPAARAEDKPRTVAVSATGTVNAEPDIALISVGVLTEDDSAKVALDENSQAMAKVVRAIKAAGVDAKDISTERFGVSPIYDRRKSSNGSYRTRTTGFRVVNMARIKVRRVADTGALIDMAVEAGANQMGAIQFIVSGQEERLDEARRAAMRNAIRRAKLYAQAAGAKVGDVLTISENVFRDGPRPVAMARSSSGMAAPIEPGQQTLRVTINVVWALE